MPPKRSPREARRGKLVEAHEAEQRRQAEEQRQAEQRRRAEEQRQAEEEQQREAQEREERRALEEERQEEEDRKRRDEQERQQREEGEEQKRREAAEAEKSDEEDEETGEAEALLGGASEPESDLRARRAISSVYDDEDAETGTMREEQRQIFRLAWPVGATFILQSSAQQMTIIFVGQLGAAQLGAASMANMWINITGMSIIYGGMSAYDTLGSQAFGAKNYPLVGLLAQRCLAICTILCVPIALSWWFLTGPVLVLVGIEQRTADLAGLFARANILCLWPTLAHNVLQRYLRNQGIVRPVTALMGLCAVGFGPVAWKFVDTFGFVGAPLANGVLNW